MSQQPDSEKGGRLQPTPYIRWNHVERKIARGWLDEILNDLPDGDVLEILKDARRRYWGRPYQDE